MMKSLFFTILMAPLLLAAQVDSSGVQDLPLVYEGFVAHSQGIDTNYRKMISSFERSFGNYSDTKIIKHSSETDSLIASSRVNFVQQDLQNKEDTRGAIRFKVRMKATENGIFYEIGEFYHSGNADSRFEPKNFGLITQSTEPPRVSGISRKSRIKIWAEMKETIDVQIKERSADFERQMALNF